jgi:hypothetical protein
MDATRSCRANSINDEETQTQKDICALTIKDNIEKTTVRNGFSCHARVEMPAARIRRETQSLKGSR